MSKIDYNQISKDVVQALTDAGFEVTSTRKTRTNNVSTGQVIYGPDKKLKYTCVILPKSESGSSTLDLKTRDDGFVTANECIIYAIGETDPAIGDQWNINDGFVWAVHSMTKLAPIGIKLLYTVELRRQ